jgi:hypothetical protein
MLPWNHSILVLIIGLVTNTPRSDSTGGGKGETVVKAPDRLDRF